MQNVNFLGVIIDLSLRIDIMRLLMKSRLLFLLQNNNNIRTLFLIL